MEKYPKINRLNPELSFWMYAAENTRWDVANEKRYMFWKKGKAAILQHDDICLLLYVLFILWDNKCRAIKVRGGMRGPRIGKRSI